MCRLQCKVLTSQITFSFRGHKSIKSHYGPYLNCCCTNCHQILTQGSLGQGLSKNLKNILSYEKETYTNALCYPPLCKKTSLAITFEVKHLKIRMLILVSRSMFWGSKYLMVPFISPYDLDLSRS